MKHTIIVVCTLSFAQLHCMEIIQKDTCDYFSPMPNKYKRKFIFPLLETCDNFDQAKKTLLAVGLTSKQCYEQMNCIFFTTDTIKLLAQKFETHDEDIALKLNTPGARYYRKLNNKLFTSITGKYGSKSFDYMRYLIRLKAADVNARFVISLTPLMVAVRYNNPHCVAYLLKKGAHVHAINNDNETVRDQCILHKYDTLEKLIKILNYYSYFSKKRNALIAIDSLNDTQEQNLLNAFNILDYACYIDERLQAAGGMVSENKKGKHSALYRIYEKYPFTKRIIKPTVTNDGTVTLNFLKICDTNDK